MPRYFIEVAYKGTNYAGFQKQDNANTIQAEVEKALSTYFRADFLLTGASRTDAGVHAKQNFFHFDSETLFEANKLNKAIYHINAILPLDIVIKSLFPVKDNAHCRFDAKSRTYEYKIYQSKNPFLQDMAYYYPYTLNIVLLQELAAVIINHRDFKKKKKKNSQVHTYDCIIYSSEWINMDGCLIYKVKANRFLRGMVKGLVGTMLRSAYKGHSIADFYKILDAKDSSKVDFSVPANGLTLLEVNY